MSTPKTPHPSRRRLFAGAGTAGALAAAAVALPQSRQAEPEATTEPRPAPEQGGGYQVTDHVLQYYRTTTI